MKIKFLTIVLLLLTPVMVFAHSGRTDSSGCHTCRTNCGSYGLSYGEYHCHQAKSYAPQPKEPVRTIESEARTVPAPEYKYPKVETIKNIVPKSEKKEEEQKPKVLGVTKSQDNNGDENDNEDSNYWWLYILGGGAVGVWAKSKYDKNKKE